MLAAVLFFIGAGQLGLADDIVEIIIDRSAADNTGLGAAVHDLAVNIKAGLFLTNEDAVGDHLMQAVGRSLVDDISIDIGILRQVDLRLIDMEEGIGVAGSHLAGLGRAHNIIGAVSYTHLDVYKRQLLAIDIDDFRRQRILENKLISHFLEMNSDGVRSTLYPNIIRHLRLLLYLS